MRSIRGPALVVALVVVVASINASDTPVSKTGTVVVRTASNYVAVGVAPAGGVKVENLFIFWPQEPMTPSVKRYERAHVDFEPGRLRIGVADQKAMKIYLVAGQHRSSTPDGYSSTSYSGSGLAHYVGGVATKFSISGEGPRDPSICYLDLGGCAGNAFDIFLPAQ